MLIPILLIGVVFIALENLIPNEKLPVSKGWYKRVVIVNIFQLFILILAAYTWDIYFDKWQFFHLEGFPDFIGGFFSYIFITFVFYWWHRFRHTNNTLWLLFHQLHHSPKRIETITSFYKHPLEIIVNSLLLSSINYLVLGLSVEAAAWSLLYAAVGEYIYHMNVKTPHAMGYFFQRPEMHKIHHEEGKHFNNFSDLPLWDMLFGTFKNPKSINVVCGFKDEREQELKAMLLFKNVNECPKVKRKKS